MKAISALLCVAFVGARPAPWSPITDSQRAAMIEDAQWTAPKLPPRRAWYPGWNGYEDVPATEPVANTWAHPLDTPPQVWSELPNPLPGMMPMQDPAAVLAQPPVMIEGVAGYPEGAYVQQSVYQQQYPQYQQPVSANPPTYEYSAAPVR